MACWPDRDKTKEICTDNEKNTVRQIDNDKVNYSSPTVILNGVFAVQIVVTAAAPYVTWSDVLIFLPAHHFMMQKKERKMQRKNIQKKMATVLELAAM